MHDARRYKDEQGIPWPLVVDDIEGTTHGGLADSTYLIDKDGRVSFYKTCGRVPPRRTRLLTHC